MRHLTGIDGVVNLSKPARWSSAKAVAAVRHQIGGRARRMGHAGTLDPRATGVLVLLVGRATHLAELIMDAGKEYVASVRLGATSSTDDIEGEITASPAAAAPDESTVREILAQFVGQIEQRPPTLALKIAGKRAYKLARRGRNVQPIARTIHIDAIELLEYRWPDLRVRVSCGRGTYVRSLARDIGQGLGVGGYLSGLVRTRVGPFRAERAVSVESCRPDNLDEWILPVEEAVEHLPAEHRVRVDDVQTELVGRGAILDARRVVGLDGLVAQTYIDPPGVVEPLAAMDSAGNLLAICRLNGMLLMPIHVLRPLFGPR